MEGKKSLNLFFGSYPDSSFIEDLSLVKEYSEKEVLELIDLVLEWYPKEDVDKEWEEWSKNFEEKEIKKKKSVIRVFIFIFKEFASGKISEEELKEDFETLNLHLSYLNNSLDKIKSSKDFIKKALSGKRPFENEIKNLDWSIDEKKYADGTKENIANIEIVYSNKGEKDIAQFDLNPKALKHLILMLQKIEDELCQDIV
jgi:hypothetical protein